MLSAVVGVLGWAVWQEYRQGIRDLLQFVALPLMFAAWLVIGLAALLGAFG